MVALGSLLTAIARHDCMLCCVVLCFLVWCCAVFSCVVWCGVVFCVFLVLCCVSVGLRMYRLTYQNGATPAHTAAALGLATIVSVLVAAGADMTAKNKVGSAVGSESGAAGSSSRCR